jgi:peptide/nickel transport system permease protein
MERLKGMWKVLRRKPMSLLGFGLIGFFLAVAALAPVLAPPESGSRDSYIIPQTGYSPDPVRPSKEHIFGTTEQQYDLYYGMVWGTRTAFKVALQVVVVSVVIGVILGGIAGFYGGLVDEVLMRFTDIILAFPDIVLAVVIVAVRGPSLTNVMVAVTVVSWPSYARLMRGDVLSVKERDFVAAARALGASDARILIRHIIPNSIYPVLVVASLSMGRIVIMAAALSFLGLGAPVNYAD